jgi:hypothetical protein
LCKYKNASNEGLSVETAAAGRSSRIFPLHFQRIYTNSIRMRIAGMNYLLEAAVPIRDNVSMVLSWSYICLI